MLRRCRSETIYVLFVGLRESNRESNAEGAEQIGPVMMSAADRQGSPASGDAPSNGTSVTSGPLVGSTA